MLHKYFREIKGKEAQHSIYQQPINNSEPATPATPATVLSGGGTEIACVAAFPGTVLLLLNSFVPTTLAQSKCTFVVKNLNCLFARSDAIVTSEHDGAQAHATAGTIVGVIFL